MLTTPGTTAEVPEDMGTSSAAWPEELVPLSSWHRLLVCHWGAQPGNGWRHPGRASAGCGREEAMLGIARLGLVLPPSSFTIQKRPRFEVGDVPSHRGADELFPGRRGCP